MYNQNKVLLKMLPEHKFFEYNLILILVSLGNVLVSILAVNKENGIMMLSQFKLQLYFQLLLISVRI